MFCINMGLFTVAALVFIAFRVLSNSNWSPQTAWGVQCTWLGLLCLNTVGFGFMLNKTLTSLSSLAQPYNIITMLCLLVIALTFISSVFTITKVLNSSEPPIGSYNGCTAASDFMSNMSKLSPLITNFNKDNPNNGQKPSMQFRINHSQSF